MHPEDTSAMEVDADNSNASSTATEQSFPDGKGGEVSLLFVSSSHNTSTLEQIV